MSLEPGERHWDIFRRLCMETDTRGPMTTDAWYAALAIQWGREWVTFDRDFMKFPGLKCTILPSRLNHPQKHRAARLARGERPGTQSLRGSQLCGCGACGSGRLRRSAMN